MIDKTIRIIFSIFLIAIIFSTIYLFVSEWSKEHDNVEKIKKYERAVNGALKDLY